MLAAFPISFLYACLTFKEYNVECRKYRKWMGQWLMFFYAVWLYRVPTVGGKTLDLHRLFVEVTSRGGLEKVCFFSHVVIRFCLQYIKFETQTGVTKMFSVQKPYISLIWSKDAVKCCFLLISAEQNSFCFYKRNLNVMKGTIVTAYCDAGMTWNFKLSQLKS